MELQLLGHAAITNKKTPTAIPLQRPTALLLYLAYQTRWLSRQELAYLFYDEEVEKEALKKLRVQLYRAKKFPWAQGLQSSGRHICWEVPTDVQRFQEAFAQQQWGRAFICYTGELLQGQHLSRAERFTEWLEFERRKLKEQWLKAGLHYSSELEQALNLEQSLSVLESLLEADPLNEGILEHLMRLGHVTGQRQKALSAFHSFKERLGAELGLDPHKQTQALALAIEQDNTAKFSSQQSTYTSLPSALDHFIGREFELADIVHALEDNCRLISIIGQGGCGKTRLALESAQELEARFQQGLAFVALAGLSNGADIMAEIANSLKLQLEDASKAPDVVKNFLREKRFLLILDNLEHLTDELEQIPKLLSECPALVILATSRARLKLPGEYVINLSGLPSSDSSSDAQRLFFTRARRLGVDTFDPVEQQAVVQICRLLGGLPLAIELAVPWLRVMSIDYLAKELSQTLDLLDAGDRQLKAVFETSWQHLSHKEKTALMKLTVFQDSFDWEAAQAITEVHLPLLLSLVDKSLLSFKQRFRFHELIRYYASQQSNALGLQKERDRHATYYADLLARAEPGLRDKQQLQTLKKLSPELANIKAFWQWSCQRQQEALLEKALGAFVDLLTLKSAFSELDKWLEQAATVTSNQSLYHRIRSRQGRSQMRLGRYESATTLLHSSLGYFETQPYPAEAAAVHLSLGTVARNQGELEKAMRHYQQALELSKQSQDAWQEALALNNIGIVLYRQGQHLEAKRHYQQSLELLKRHGAQWATALPRNNLALIASADKDYQTAERYLQENLTDFSAIGDRKGQALSLSNLGSLAYAQANFKEAEALFAASLSITEDIGEQWALTNDLVNMAFTQLELGKPGQALSFLKRAGSYSEQIKAQPMMLYVLVGYGHWLALQKNLRAAEILRFCLHHQSSNAFTKERAKGLLERYALKVIHKSSPDVSLEVLLQALQSS